MKKLTLSLLFVGITGIASAQSTYVITLSTSGPQDTILQEIITIANQKTCERFNLAVTCTQANVCAAMIPVISPCDATTARARGGRIWGPTVNADRVEFLEHGKLRPALVSDKRDLADYNTQRATRDWVTGVVTQTEKNTACTALHRPVPCTLFEQ